MPDIEHSDKGNDHLCSFEMQLWGIVYTVALEWGTMVIFQWKMMHVPNKVDGLVNFFVPKDATHRYEICEFIEGHLKRLRREATEDEKYGYFPGMQATIYCTIFTFNGVHPEMRAGASDAMIKEWTKGVRLDLGAPKRRERVKLQAMERLNADPEFAEKLLGSMLPSRLEKLMSGEE